MSAGNPFRGDGTNMTGTHCAAVAPLSGGVADTHGGLPRPHRAPVNQL
jgi:hypothetical protein